MLHLTLTREPADGLSVRGVLKLHTGSDPLCSFEPGPRSPSSNGIPSSAVPASSSSLCSGIPTLENQQYLIPCGTYPLEVTYSPRFKRLMPLVSAVPGRSGIRFHPGTKPEHSKGCILVSRSDESLLRDLITSHAPVTITIR